MEEGFDPKSLHTSQLSFMYVTMETYSQICNNKEICHQCIFSWKKPPKTWRDTPTDCKINPDFLKNQEWIGNRLSILIYFVFITRVPNIGEGIYGTAERTYYETSGCKSQLFHWLTLWLWANHSNSLSLNFFTYSIKIMIPSSHRWDK